jgi:signal transduction protein with GAF and PtsI domain
MDLSELEEILHSESGVADRLSQALSAIVKQFDCSAGTIHLLDGASGMLTLAAQHGIPEVVLARIRTVPLGKGIAGLAAQEARPVQLCNLQTDTSGVAEPGAKQTNVEGSLAVPIFAGEIVRGTLGVGKRVPYEFNDTECELLTEAGRLIAAHLPE